MNRRFAAVVIFGALCAALIFERDTLSCDRDAGTCTLTRRKLSRSFARSFPVGDLMGAELAEIPSRDSESGPSRQIVILIRQDRIPLMGYGSGLFREAMQEDVGAVASYVATPSARRLDVRHQNFVVALIAGGFAFVVAGAVALATLDWKGAKPPTERAG